MDGHAPDERPEFAQVGHTSDDAHELRTALTVAMGWTQVVQSRLRRGDDPAAFAPRLDHLEAALRRIEAVAQRLDRDQA